MRTVAEVLLVLFGILVILLSGLLALSMSFEHGGVPAADVLVGYAVCGAGVVAGLGLMAGGKRLGHRRR